MDRRAFLDRAAKFAVAGVTAAMLLEELSPNFAAAQGRLRAERVEYASSNGSGRRTRAPGECAPSAVVPRALARLLHSFMSHQRRERLAAAPFGLR